MDLFFPSCRWCLILAVSVLICRESAAPAASPGIETAEGPRAFTGSKAGEEREVAGVKLGWCPAGRFLMGSPRNEPERRPGETQVEVTLTKGFWTGKYEVSQAQWKRVIGKLPGVLTPAGGEGDDMAVYNVNYPEAEEFCRKLTELGHKSGELPEEWEFRLPTEAQWEYACRAGTTTATAFGDKLSSTQANFTGKPYNGAEEGPTLKRAAKVGSYAPNAWGLCDMHGNLSEWCRDWFHAGLPGGSDPDLSSVKGIRNRDGTYSRARRGSSWLDDGWASRSAFRQKFESDRRFENIGFRVVAVQTASSSQQGSAGAAATSPKVAANRGEREGSDSGSSPYASDSNHLWNRLHRALFVRTDRDGKLHVHTTDPLLWHGRTTQRDGVFTFGTFHLLEGESHERAIEVLDQFLNEHGERLIDDPLKRMFLQHDTWAAFDYAAWYPDEWVYHSQHEPAAIALRARLAKTIGRLALRDSEVKALPDNYAKAVASKQFPADHDPRHPEQSFLPPDLVDPAGTWVRIHDASSAEPMAPQHFQGAGGRAVHLVFLRLPGGRAATEKYLEELDPASVKQFPPGTMVAMVRRALTVDQSAKLRVTPLTELVQIRVYRRIPEGRNPDFGAELLGQQDVYEFVLDRRNLFAGQSGLRAVGADEPAETFTRHPADDPFDPRADRVAIPGPQMKSCTGCHQSPGIYSVSSMERGLGTKAKSVFRTYSWDVETSWTVTRKVQNYKWGMLQGMLEQGRQDEEH
jgi:formylglycine-generating enzyme required for sulfatase activity